MDTISVAHNTFRHFRSGLQARCIRRSPENNGCTMQTKLRNHRGRKPECMDEPRRQEKRSRNTPQPQGKAIGIRNFCDSSYSPAFKFDKSQSMCPRQRTKEKPTTASNEKASHETKPLQGRARTTRKLQGNNVSRLCKQDQCESITILQRNASKSQLAPERERPVLAIQPQPVKRMALWL